MKNKKIASMQVGEKIEGFYLLKGYEKKQTSTGKEYLDLLLADRSGEIKAKVWGIDKAVVGSLENKNLVKILASVDEWKSNLQLRIDKIRLATAEDNMVLDDYVPASPATGEEMYLLLQDFIAKIKQPDLKIIVEEFVARYKEKLLYYPAAQLNHHALKGGLLYHTTTMLRMAEKTLQVYQGLDQDLLYAGVIVHDLAKIEEMDADVLGIVEDYTVPGQLLGHITQGILVIKEIAKKHSLNQEVVTVLQHLVLTHHYEPEYGSPKKPMLPEGEVLHFLDLLDARLYDMQHYQDQTVPGSFSEKVWRLDNRRIYHPSFRKEVEEDE